MTAYPFTYTITVRYADLDPLGHVNNAVYFSYLETARVEYLRPLLGLERGELRPGFVIASARCDYRSPAYYGEELTVAVRVSRVGRSSFDLEYRVTGPDGRLVAEGHTVQVAVGPDGRSRPLPDAWRERLERALTEGGAPA